MMPTMAPACDSDGTRTSAAGGQTEGSEKCCRRTAAVAGIALGALADQLVAGADARAVAVAAEEGGGDDEGGVLLRVGGGVGPDAQEPLVVAGVGHRDRLERAVGRAVAVAGVEVDPGLLRQVGVLRPDHRDVVAVGREATVSGHGRGGSEMAERTHRMTTMLKGMLRDRGVTTNLME